MAKEKKKVGCLGLFMRGFIITVLVLANLSVAGIIVGAVTLTGQFNEVDLSQGSGSGGDASLVLLLPILLPVAILVVPLLDLVLAVVRRTRAGRSPFAPDKQHLHHRLLEIGHSQRRAVFIMWLWAGLVAFGTVLVSLYSGPIVVGGVVAATLLTVAFTFLLPRLHRPAVEA